MLNPQVLSQYSSLSNSKTLFPWHKPFISGKAGTTTFSTLQKQNNSKKNKCFRVRCISGSNKIKAVASPAATNKSTRVLATVIVQVTVGGLLSNLGWNRVLDEMNDLLGKSLLLELVAAEVDPSKY